MEAVAVEGDLVRGVLGGSRTEEEKEEDSGWNSNLLGVEEDEGGGEAREGEAGKREVTGDDMAEEGVEVPWPLGSAGVEGSFLRRTLSRGLNLKGLKEEVTAKKGITKKKKKKKKQQKKAYVRI